MTTELDATEDRSRPPRDGLVRAAYPAIEIRDDSGDGASIGTMTGYFSKFGTAAAPNWYEVNSVYEGHFLETVAPGAFKKTIAENRGQMKATLNHGKDPQAGDKPLGPITVLEEDGVGARYEVELLDTSYNRDILPGLKAGLYGSSFRFQVVKDDFNTKPVRGTAHNPNGLPERTIREARVQEFGPVTFPASASATASVRSMTDDYILDQFTRDPERLADLIDHLRSEPALPDAGAEAKPHSDQGSRDEPPAVEPAPVKPIRAKSKSKERIQVDLNDFRSKEDMISKEREIKDELKALGQVFPLPANRQAEWDGLVGDQETLKRAIAAQESRERVLLSLDDDAHAVREDNVVQPKWQPTQFSSPNTQIRDIYDLGEARKVSGGDDVRYDRIVRDSSLREVEHAQFPSSPDKARAGDQIDRLIRSEGSLGTEVAHRVLTTGSPAYRRFFNKLLTGGYPTPEEQRAAALTGLGATTTTGGYATVYELDPTIMPTSNGAVNPYRRMSRVIQTNHNEWRGVTSAGVTAVYGGEASTAVEAGPTLAQPAAIVQKAQTQVSYSIEAGEDIADLSGQVAVMIADAKDVLEATQFTTGAGTTVFPQGICGVGSTTYYTTATTTVLAAADLYGVEATLPPRFRAKARWLANRFIYNKIRGIDTAGGAQLWTQNLTVGLPNRVDGNTGYNLLGYPADECSGMAASVATTQLEAVFGDFDYFVIIDKIGMNIEVIPLVQASGYATGQRAIYAYWRNTSKCLNSASFIVMKGL